MTSPPDPDATQSFVNMARDQALLTPNEAAAITRDAQELGLKAAQIAVQQGALDAIEVDIVETLLKPGEAIPGYEILGVLGRGGMGVVYRARQKNLNRLVAIKTVLMSQIDKAGALARFEKEAVAVARFQHPNIVTAYDFGKHQGRLYFVMELLEGEDLLTRIERQGRLDEATAWGLARQVAGGLAHASEQGIIHRDIKPANLFLVPSPSGYALPPGQSLVKITDFGLVLLTAEAFSPRLTRAGATLGTPAYMAPEQTADGAVDCRADIYALGASVYHMLGGKPPFAGASLWHVLTLKMAGELPELSELASAPSASLIRDMMAVDPGKRIGGYPELLERIDRVFATPAGAWARLPDLPRVNRWKAWRGKKLMGLVGMVLLAVVLCAWLYWRVPPGNQTVEPSVLEAGQEFPLFDGSSLNDWSTEAGVWTPARDAEGGKVLEGRGMILRKLPALANYRLTMALDLNHATAAELQFGLRESVGKDQSCYLARVDREGVAFGERKAGHLADLSKPMPFPIPKDPGMSPYRELRVERQGRSWWVYFDGKFLGQWESHPEVELSEMRLAVEGGPARFDSVAIVELIEPTAPREAAGR